MFHFPACAPYIHKVPDVIRWVSPFRNFRVKGCLAPRRNLSQPYHVFHRSFKPRHPPYTLTFLQGMLYTAVQFFVAFRLLLNATVLWTPKRVRINPDQERAPPPGCACDQTSWSASRQQVNWEYRLSSEFTILLSVEYVYLRTLLCLIHLTFDLRQNLGGRVSVGDEKTGVCALRILTWSNPTDYLCFVFQVWNTKPACDVESQDFI